MSDRADSLRHLAELLESHWMSRYAEDVREIADHIDHLERIKAQAIIDTRDRIIYGSYLEERSAMSDLLGMDERGNIKEGE